MESKRITYLLVLAGLAVIGSSYLAEFVAVTFGLEVITASRILVVGVGTSVVGWEWWKLYRNGFREVWNRICSFEDTRVVFRVWLGVGLVFTQASEATTIPRLLTYSLYSFVIVGLVYFVAVGIRVGSGEEQAS